jgi:heat shock protein HtpX
VGVVATEAANAIAVGLTRRRSQIVLTSGLLRLLTRDELEAVLAAELIAVERLDVAVRTLAAVYAYGTRALYRSYFPAGYERSPMTWPWVAALWPTQWLAKRMWRSVLSVAATETDELAVAVTHNPEALLSALVKLRHDHRRLAGVPAMTAPLWLEPGDVEPAPPEVSPFATAPLVKSFDARIEHLSHVCGLPVPPVRP